MAVQPTPISPDGPTAQAANERRRPWDDDEDSAAAGAATSRPLSREQAQALREREPSLNPWRVVAVQAAVGAGLALLMGLLFGAKHVAWSALYGAACVVLPAALMARGMTSQLSRMSPSAGALSFMVWEMVKIAVSVLMLALAPKLVQPLSWPALLVGLAVCIKVYWFALLWRGRGTG